ncbi:MAG: hypothetical protein E6G50_09005, partial [Actinobacteria bacterium]
MKKRLSVLGALGAMLLALPLLSTQASADPTGSAPPLGPLATLSPSMFATLDDPTGTDYQATASDPSKMPPGSKYKLFGTAKDDTDPQNPYNEVISFDTTDPTAVAGAYRKLGDHVQIDQLTDMIELKYLFVGRSCDGGSPRVTLLVDANGDGKFVQEPNGPDFAIHGHLNPPATSACPAGQWRYEDLTDSGNRWEVTPCTAGMPPALVIPGILCYPYSTWQS